MNDIILTAGQAKEADKEVREQLGIDTLVLMENAGRAVAEAVLDLAAKNKRIAVFCGRGNNAGDGFVAARHLISRGREVDVYLVGGQDKIRNEAGINLGILRKITDRIFEVKDSKALGAMNLADYALVVDALLGIGLKGEVEGLFREAISLINKSGIPVLAVDVPSGLDATTGKVCGIAICADTTVTFMAKKQGLLSGQGPRYSGRIIVGNLGLPAKTYDVRRRP